MEKGSGADLGLFPGRFRGHGDRPGERRQHEKPGAEVFGNYRGFRTCKKLIGHRHTQIHIDLQKINWPQTHTDLHRQRIMASLRDKKTSGYE